MHPAPIVGTFHAAGRSSGYQVFDWFLRWVAERIDRKVVVSKDALELVQSYFGGEYDILFNGVEIDEIAVDAADARRRSRRSSSAAATRSARASPSCSRRSSTLPADARLWIASDGPDGPRLRQQYAGDDRITWLGRISDAEKFARLRGATCSAPRRCTASRSASC